MTHPLPSRFSNDAGAVIKIDALAGLGGRSEKFTMPPLRIDPGTLCATWAN
jgi:hypothetical protein